MTPLAELNLKVKEVKKELEKAEAALFTERFKSAGPQRVRITLDYNTSSAAYIIIDPDGTWKVDPS